MHYRRLGESGLKISEIGLGGWLTFANAVDIEQGRAVMDAAFDAGINFFDTSNAYARGKCEEVWGGYLEHRPRDAYVLATKVFFPTGPAPTHCGLSRKHIMEQCAASLRRLKTDYVDLYQCHRHDPETPMEETVRAMDDLIHQGKILYWGFSEWPVAKIEECLRICGAGYYAPRSSQPQYSALHRDIEREVMPLCAKAGIGQVVWSPLAQGILSGKYKPGQAPPTDSRGADDRQNQFIKSLVQNHALLEKVQRLVPLAEEQQCTLSQLALAWALRKKEISSCIIGATRPSQIEENAEASGISLDAEVLARMEEILASGEGKSEA